MYGAVDPEPPILLLSCPCWTKVPHVPCPSIGSFLEGPEDLVAKVYTTLDPACTWFFPSK